MFCLNYSPALSSSSSPLVETRGEELLDKVLILKILLVLKF